MLGSQSAVGEALTQPEPNHWLLFASRNTWKHLQSRGEWAFASKVERKIEGLAENDIGIVYLRSDMDAPSALGGLIEFSGRLHRISGRNLFDQMFPVRIPIIIRKVSDPPIEFKPFVKRICFITNKSNWGSHLQGRAMLRLDDSDYSLLADAIQNKT